MSGRLIAVVGPSGVGKDTVMAALAARRPELAIVRRTITRAPDAGGEEFDPVSVQDFQAMREAGDFVLDWQAHGLQYGIPVSLLTRLGQGQDAIVNLSRTVLDAARVLFPEFQVLYLTASPGVLARRLVARGREDADGVAARQARTAPGPTIAGDVIEICNDGSLTDTVAKAETALFGAGSRPPANNGLVPEHDA